MSQRLCKFRSSGSRAGLGIPLTALPDSVAFGLRFVFRDARSAGLRPLSLSSRLVGGGTVEQLLGAPSPDEGSWPR